ncbi:MAG: dUTP diphosphatase [Candidatus Pacebacteria bacterium]|nr:dUTP diphosphatase [Candidatus Paceibacterota bacterium]PIR60427.1 MAG: dUTP diphosphatase [Candidatus Pacebacteria bacterium CG10_big_fil_rev_8_21_14_0_10_44_54]
MKPVLVGIKRFDTSLPLPAYKSVGAAALDLVARLEVEIAPHAVGYVPLNIALELPEGYWALVAARSSLHKRGLLLANGIGVGDHDFRGDGDEYVAALLNFTDKPVIIERGERIAQLMIQPAIRIELQEKMQFVSKDRGGFGSTGRS